MATLGLAVTSVCARASLAVTPDCDTQPGQQAALPAGAHPGQGLWSCRRTLTLPLSPSCQHTFPFLPSRPDSSFTIIHLHSSKRGNPLSLPPHPGFHLKEQLETIFYPIQFFLGSTWNRLSCSRRVKQVLPCDLRSFHRHRLGSGPTPWHCPSTRLAQAGWEDKAWAVRKAHR